MAAQKKRHHFVPVTYLKGFTDPDGFLSISRKDDPDRTVRGRPSEAAFRNYYYSQPTGDGSMNHNALEDLFSTLESTWPGIVDVLASGLALNTVVQELLTMIGFQRVRVPAFRDAIEQSLERHARGGLEELKRRGDLPPPPPEFPNLLDLTEITIDPHQSIHGMTKLLRSLGPVLDTLGYQVLHNNSAVDFITSDNPVSYFTIKHGRITPYEVNPNATSELIFPVTGRMAIFGSTADRKRFRQKGLKAVQVRDPERIRAMNRTTAQFAYEALFSAKEISAAFVRRYPQSPVLTPISEGFHPDDMRMPAFCFGQRRKLLKWRY